MIPVAYPADFSTSPTVTSSGANPAGAWLFSLTVAWPVCSPVNSEHRVGAQTGWRTPG